MSTENAVRGLLDIVQQAISDGVFSCAQAEVGVVARPLVQLAVGTRAFATVAPSLHEPIDRRTPFDLASLTKVVATTTVAMHAVREGVLRLDMRLADVGLAGLHEALADVKVGDLLRHRSGLIAWLPFYEGVPARQRGTTAGRDLVRSAVAGRGPEPGRVVECYSDLGMILADWVLERRYGATLDALFDRVVRQPLDLRRIGYVRLRAGAKPLADAAATEVVAWRGGLVCGVVHDENTWAMGGVSGHAGLFGTASELGVLARALLAADRGEGTWLPPSVLHAFWDRSWLGEGERFLMGWDTPSGEATTAGRQSTRESTVGHLGFTGTSLWLDRARGAYAVLLTNRVHPSRDEPRINPLRTTFNDAAWALVDG